MSKKTKLAEVGDEIFTLCGKCKAEMYHVVTAVDKGGVIKKVMCKGCNTTHVYKADKAGATKRKKAVVPKEKKMKTRRRRIRKYDWEALSAEVSEDELVDYDFSMDLTEVRAIRHRTFGIGVITKVLSHNQIEVLFKDETRILMHNYDPVAY